MEFNLIRVTEVINLTEAKHWFIKPIAKVNFNADFTMFKVNSNADFTMFKVNSNANFTMFKVNSIGEEHC